MRGLRDRWVDALRNRPNAEICVPDDPARYCAITSFGLKGMATDEDAKRAQRLLPQRRSSHGIRLNRPVAYA